MKTCRQCKVDKLEEEFNKFTHSSDGLALYCKACVKEKRKDRNLIHDNPLFLSKRMFRKYGLTLKEYEKLYESQNKACAICKTLQCDLKKRLYVDHNHDTGEIRGLLCYKCNTFIGFANDDIEILEIAINYLKHKMK